jgi:hypothetical protein
MKSLLGIGIKARCGRLPFNEPLPVRPPDFDCDFLGFVVFGVFLRAGALFAGMEE